MLVIGPGTVEQARRYAQRFRLPFSVAADPDRSVYRRFGLNRILLRLLQRSGVFLLDGTGTIRFAHAATNPEASLPIQQVLENLRQLAETDRP